jgi:hypothetical protein
MDRTRWTSSMACSQYYLNPFGSYLCGYVKSTVYSAEASNMQNLQQRIERMEVEWFVRNLEFLSNYEEYCADVPRRALKLRVDSLIIF